MDHNQIDEELDRAERRDEAKARWTNWVSASDVIQLAVMLVVVTASYVRLSASIAETRTQIIAQAAVITNLHESVDQLRMNRNMTPEAAQKFTALEARVDFNETTVREVRMELNKRLERIEDKLDDLLEKQRR